MGILFRKARNLWACQLPLGDSDPLSSCGGDCLGCVGEFEADGWALSAEKVREEVAPGFRHSDGSAKPHQAGPLLCLLSARRRAAAWQWDDAAGL